MKRLFTLQFSWSVFFIVLMFLSLSHSFGQVTFNQHPIGNLGGGGFLKVADMDNDGENDDVVACGTINGDNIVLYENDNWNWVSHQIVANWVHPIISIGDIDLDGDNDVVAGTWAANKISWFENPGWTQHSIDSNLSGASGVVAVDMDNDDTLDVVADGIYANQLVWYKGPNWTKTIIDSQVVSSPPRVPDYVWVKDIDGDDDLDIFLAVGQFNTSIEGALIFYENLGNNITWNKIIVDPETGWIPSIDFGDLDGDDTLEVVVNHFGFNRVVIYDYPSWNRSTIDNFYHAAGVGIADIDGDGDADVVASGKTTTNPLRWYEYDGSNWIRHNIYQGNHEFFGIAVTDLDNDTDMDIVASIIGLGTVTWFDNQIILNPESIEEDRNAELPYDFILSQNYPNPFNPSTNIQFSIPKTEFVTLKIFNLLGQEVATLVSEKLKAGEYNYTWDAGSQASGIYLYKIQSGDYQEVKKMILLQ